MSDPARLRHQNAGEVARLLLESARIDAPKEGVEQRVLAAVGTTLLGPAWAASGGYSLGRLGSGLTRKVVVFGKWTAVAATATFGVLSAIGGTKQPNAPSPRAAAVSNRAPGSTPSPPVTSPHNDQPEQTGASTGAESPIGQQAVAGLVRPSGSAKRDASVARRTPAGAIPSALQSRLALEVTSLDIVRAELKANHGSMALALLAKHSRDFPHGHLAPEADLLRIQAHVINGDRARAARLAERFLNQYPSGWYSTRVRELLGTARPREP